MAQQRFVRIGSLNLDEIGDDIRSFRKRIRRVAERVADNEVKRPAGPPVWDAKEGRYVESVPQDETGLVMVHEASPQLQANIDKITDGISKIGDLVRGRKTTLLVGAVGLALGMALAAVIWWFSTRAVAAEVDVYDAETGKMRKRRKKRKRR